jgi:hypothetical protein
VSLTDGGRFIPRGAYSPNMTDGTDADPAGLRRARRVATLLDGAVRIPGTNVRVGLDPALSLVPALGDGAGFVAGVYVVIEAWLAGVAGRTLARMVVNLAVDATLGAIPVVGPLIDAALRVNERNVDLFERAVA